jgi:hypothetical protein
MTKHTLRIAVALVAAVAIEALGAQEVKRTPLPEDHPLVGTWRLTFAESGCFEIYDVHADGTTRVTSAEEVAETEFQIATELTGNGFYKWVDKLVKDNGKPDCMGAISKVGTVTTNFVRMHRNGRQFIMCRQEDLDTCFGPFVMEPRM